MKMDTMTLEAYLDGQLADEQMTALRQALDQDAHLRDTLRRLQTQRALRAAALATYQPDASEAAELTARFMDATTAPVGRVGPMVWVRRLSAVAAMLLIVAGAYYTGRQSTQAQVLTKTVVQDHYVVHIITPEGEATEHSFASLEEANDFVAEVVRQQNGTTVAGIF